MLKTAYNGSMSRFIRKVQTASGATAVQIITKSGRERVALEHIGSAHTDEDLSRLITLAKERLNAGQLSLFPDETPPKITTEKTISHLLWEQLASVYSLLGFDEIGDEVFKQLVIARIIEPASKLDTVRILENLGLDAPSNTGIHRCLARIIENDYRSQLAKTCFKQANVKRYSLVLYDVTTLYFEIQKEDEFRKSGLSKERRLEPQITVGLLVNEHGFPLEIASFEGNKAEVHTMIPVLESFKAAHGLENIVVVADAAMLSSKNLETLEELGYHYIVSSRIKKCPYEIEVFRQAEETECEDGQIFELKQSFTVNHKRVKRRVIYQYRAKRAKLDLSNIDKSLVKAEKMVSGATNIKRNRFVKLTGTKRSLNLELVESAKARAGIKGYVTNLADDAQTIINAYHQLFEVERSFRMSKSDLRARPIFHHKRESIEAHLTVVFAALAISRFIQDKTEVSIRKFVKTLEPIRDSEILIDGKSYQAPATPPANIQNLIRRLHE